ncbi:SPT2-domain-containing protein [Phellopilus nigrolimitatus]|nr:SPT2-domain-containing protein [Phellopilus nigrolimitatus]
MSARFADLMALSASQTRESDLATKHLLAEKKRKEDQRRKEQEEKDRKDRELRVKLVQKRLEEQQRAEERKRRLEEDRHKKEQELQRREEEHRKNLIYGKERRSGWGNSRGGGPSRKAREGSDDDDDTRGPVLTREEKRQRKLLAGFSAAKKSQTSSPSHARPSRPQQVVDSSYSRSSEPRSNRPRPTETRSTFPSGAAISAIPDPSKSNLSIRQQFAAMPNTLIRLNTVKRDTRTIAEIMQDRERAKEAKVLAGDEAREFNNWFGDTKKRSDARPIKKTASEGSSLSPSPSVSMPNPAPARPKEPAPVTKPSARPAPSNSQFPEKKEPRTKVTVVKPEPKGSLVPTKVNKVSGSTSAKANGSISKASALPTPRTPTSAANPLNSSKKRTRSYSLSESEDDSPPSKRRPAASSGRSDISSEIWKLFGKDRDRYVRNDVFSDEDDDMEVDADALRREEMRSARLAKKEDEAALEDEKRHEEEKRKRKKEKDRRG